MRIVITGATGNLGTSLLEQLAREGGHTVTGLARRPPRGDLFGAHFARADVARDDLDPLFAGADAVVHFAWRLQPSHAPELLDRTNVEGSRRVFEAAVRAGVGILLYASSIGAYASGPKDRRVDESFPVTGVQTSLYSRQKARVETILDDVERNAPNLRVVRFRPALVFKRTAASDIHRLFLGPLVPRVLLSRRLLIIPDHPRLRFQCVHSLDVGDAFRRALHRNVRGAFNLAADPVLDGRLIASRLGGHRIRMPRAVLRSAAAAAWRLRLIRSEEGWLDLAMETPLIDSSRARSELDWRPAHDALEALGELLDGLRHGEGMPTPPLEPRVSQPRPRPRPPEGPEHRPGP